VPRNAKKRAIRMERRLAAAVGSWQHPNSEARGMALATLADLSEIIDGVDNVGDRREEIAAILVQALQDPDSTVRLVAAGGLGTVNVRSAFVLAGLTTATYDIMSGVRQEAAMTLAYLAPGNEHVQRRLLDLLDDRSA
jgi:HEAT repeat protein